MPRFVVFGQIVRSFTIEVEAETQCEVTPALIARNLGERPEDIAEMFVSEPRFTKAA